MVIDGGRAQLNAAREVLQQAGWAAMALLALAENPDRIFLEQETAPLLLPANSTLLQLLQRIRDEAHRFAVDYHRRLRRKSATRSRLEEIPGIGPQRRTALLKHFGSLEQLYRAGEEELTAVPGINRILAGKIYRQLHS
jgi:excinuclease ABC subunit C